MMATATHSPVPRQLTEEERTKLSKDQNVVSAFKQEKLEKEALKNWDLFYKRNSTKFFKDRHWTTREFTELCGNRKDGEMLKILEVGCGVGNFLFPLIEADNSLFCYACDFSPRAVQFVKDNPLYASTGRCHAFQCDLTVDSLEDEVKEPVDLVTMIFVLSAIHPEKMLAALRNVYKVLRDGGTVLFRDYGRYDYAQLRFSSGHKLMDNFYVRQDGTRAYYFTQEELSELAQSAGFTVTANDYIFRETVNKKEGVCVPRIFLQSKLTKLPVANNTDENNTGATDTGVNNTGATDTGVNNTGVNNTTANNTEENITGATNTGATDTGATNTGANNTGINNTEETKNSAINNDEAEKSEQSIESEQKEAS